MQNFFSDNPIIGALLIVGLTVLYIAIATAILKLPRIARYQLAQLKLTALIAKQQGVNPNAIQDTLKESDAGFQHDQEFQKNFNGSAEERE
jgi:hypothetical protein